MRIFLLLFIILVSDAYSKIGWEWQNPRPTGNIIIDMKSNKENEIVCLCKYGSIIKSTDAGETWKTIYIIEKPSYFWIDNDIAEAFCSFDYFENKIWAVSSDIYNTRFTLYFSNDYGKTWDKTDIFKYTINEGRELYSQVILLDMKSTSNGYMYMDTGEIFSTVDGGKTWQKTDELLNKKYESKIQFKNDELGWVRSDKNSLNITQNGGMNWKEYKINYEMDWEKFFLLDINTWLAVDNENHMIFKTVDGGNNWEVINTNLTFEINDLYLFNEKYGIAVGNNGYVFKTNNGGITWDKDSLGKYDLKRFLIRGNNTWIMPQYKRYELVYNSFKNVLYRSTNRGNSWENMIKGSQDDISSIYFADHNTGWALSLFDVLHTTDGGNSWNSQLKTTEALWKMFFYDKNHGWVQGDSNFYITTDAGKNWGKSLYHIKEGKWDFSFIDEKIGWFSAGNKLYKSVDGGNSWDLLVTHDSLEFLNIHFIDDKNGVAAANPKNATNYYATLYKSTDGGISWEIRSNRIYIYYLSYLFFRNIGYGWFLGQNNYLKTTDSGKTWADYKFYIYILDELHCIYASADNKYCWLSTKEYAQGDQYALYFSSDSGQNWDYQNYGSFFQINDIFFIDDTTGWLCGENGMIMHTTTAGLPESPVINSVISEKNNTNNEISVYPIPSGELVHFSYDLEKPASVEIGIYDGLGNEVLKSIYIDREAGRHTETLNISGLTPGIYFYRLKAGSMFSAGKLLIMK